MQFSICNYAVWYQLVSEFKFVYNYNELFRVSLDRKRCSNANVPCNAFSEFWRNCLCQNTIPFELIESVWVSPRCGNWFHFISAENTWCCSSCNLFEANPFPSPSALFHSFCNPVVLILKAWFLWQTWVSKAGPNLDKGSFWSHPLLGWHRVGPCPRKLSSGLGKVFKNCMEMTVL